MKPPASSGRERLQKVLVDLGRPADRSPRRGAALGPAAAESSREGSAAPQDPRRLVELTERLERIERKLSDLAEPVDGIPDRFRRWIAEGHWEHVRFSEFLRLKR